MNNVYKGKAKYILASIALVHILVLTLQGKNLILPVSSIGYFLTSDTIPPVSQQVLTTKTVSLESSSLVKKQNNPDSIIPVIKTDSFIVKNSKDSLNAPVYYHADDSMVFDIPRKKIMLYGKGSSTKYEDNELFAPNIEFDQNSHLITAALVKDSTGKVIAFPSFNQHDLKTISDTITYNISSGKGITKGTYTQQGEMFIYAERIKKVDTSVFYAYKGRFTTCQLDTPHFAFVSNKIKFINKKMAITGPVHPEIEGVPLPIVLPFGIFPLTQGRHSGLLAPTFSANEQLGLSLEGLGYYKVLNDNWDITTRATIYSYGGWNAAVSPRYYKRYHYQGNFAFNYQHFRTNFPGDPDYSLSKTFNVTWSHSSDTKARPGVTFNANVNVASSKFNSQVPNNNLRNFTNSLSSTILYSKVWKDLPFNLSLNANHTQNTIDKSFNVTLPDVSFNINTMYPFRRKEVIGSYKWYENIGIALNSSLRNHTHFTDDSLTVLKTPVGQQIIDNLQWGGNHSIPISLSLPAIGPLQISPQVGYTERWYQEKMSLSWDSSAKKIDTLNKKGFYTARDMSFGISASTRIFGMFGFGKHSRIQAIRHEIRPSISFSYKPDMNGYAYHNIQVDSIGHTTRYSIYQNSLYGAFGEGKFGGMSFSIDNNLSMKLLNKKDTGEAATKKISLIDGFSISGNYNFLLDSFRLSQLSVTARSNLFDKISISASATIDPYQTDSTGRDINRLVWKDKILTLGRLMSGNITLSSQFQGGDQKKKKKNLQNPASAYNPNTGMPLNEYETEAAYISNNPAEYADFSIPWSFNFAYSLRFQKSRVGFTNVFKTDVNQDVNMNGTLNLTKKWQLGVTAFYNITQSQLGSLALSVARDMHCWQMAINISPVGHYRFFNITISPKSPLLKDLKVNRTRNFYDL